MKRFALIPVLLLPLALTACGGASPTTTATPGVSPTPLTVSTGAPTTPASSAATTAGELGVLTIEQPTLTFKIPASGYQLVYTCTTTPGIDENNTSYGYSEKITSTGYGGGGSLTCDGTKQHELTESSDVTFFKDAGLDMILSLSDPKHEVATFNGTVSVLD